ncbi:YqhA family protein [Devosia sp. A449]
MSDPTNDDVKVVRSTSVGSGLVDHKAPWPLRLIGQLVSGVMIVPVVATMVAAVALIIYGTIESWHFVDGLFFSVEHRLTRDEVLLHAIELVDLFLLATVVQVVSLGLYQLYFNQDLQLPDWLKIRTLDDLKSKLVGVSVTVLAVYFLGRAITSSGGIDILYLGGATAVVIVALTWFLSTIDDHH